MTLSNLSIVYHDPYCMMAYAVGTWSLDDLFTVSMMMMHACKLPPLCAGSLVAVLYMYLKKVVYHSYSTSYMHCSSRVCTRARADMRYD